MKISVSWDESGTKVENKLDFLIVDQHSIKNGIVEHYSLTQRRARIEIYKPNGAYNKNQECLSLVIGNDDSGSSIFIYIKTPKIKFFDLEFFKIKIEFGRFDLELNNFNHLKPLIFEKTLRMNQNGRVFHIGNIVDNKLETVFDFIDSLKVISKKLKIDLKRYY